MELIHNFFNWLNGIVWGVPMIVLIIGTGFFLQLRLGFMPIRKLVYGFRMIWKKISQVFTSLIIKHRHLTFKT